MFPYGARMPTSDAVYHLKIVLADVAPTIWRRFQVPASMTLADLHRTIQIVMGWEEWHFHKFHVAGEVYGSWQLPDGLKDERGVLGELVPPTRLRQARGKRPAGKVKSLFLYEYNTRCQWMHEVRVEKVTRPNPEHRYPRCIAGAWAAPPENCFGANEYRDVRLDRPRGEDVFDVDEVNEELRREFSLEPEREPPSSPVLKVASGESVASTDAAGAIDRTLPEPFETIVRAREGRASPEEELRALVHMRRLLDTGLGVLQHGLHTKSNAKQEYITKEIARTRKTRDTLEEKIAALEEKLDVSADEIDDE